MIIISQDGKFLVNPDRIETYEIYHSIVDNCYYILANENKIAWYKTEEEAKSAFTDLGLTIALKTESMYKMSNRKEESP